MREELRLRNYSPRTIKAYVSCVRTFARHIAPILPRDATENHIRSYLLDLLERKESPAGTVNQVYNALRFLYEEMYHRPFVIKDLPRPKKERRLPVVLSTQEVRRLLDAPANPKHRLMLALLYSAGLRLGELVRLRPEDLDRDRRTIHVRQGKGAKDRRTILAPAVMERVDAYLTFARPLKYLFEGASPGEPYSPRSVQNVFEAALAKAGIKKNATVHSLRHAFATHLLEQGTDIRFIQELLGHSSLKTTEIYTHVANKVVQSIRSPIEALNLDDGPQERENTPQRH
jgi:site-specific recombinase XerD